MVLIIVHFKIFRYQQKSEHLDIIKIADLSTAIRSVGVQLKTTDCEIFSRAVCFIVKNYSVCALPSAIARLMNF